MPSERRCCARRSAAPHHRSGTVTASLASGCSGLPALEVGTHDRVEIPVVREIVLVGGRACSGRALQKATLVGATFIEGHAYTRPLLHEAERHR